MSFFCTYRTTTGNFGPGNLPDKAEADPPDSQAAEKEEDEDDIPVSQLVKARSSAPPSLKKRKAGDENNAEKENDPKMKFNSMLHQIPYHRHQV